MTANARCIARHHGAHLAHRPCSNIWIAAARDLPKGRDTLSAGNQAHAFAACTAHDKKALLGGNWPNIAIISAYNDMLSAHQPYHRYPDLIRDAARDCGATAQFAGGVPAMCDGVTQGQPGMELSLFSRDVIAMSTAIALTHNSFDAALFLGICDKIVPGLLIGALQFGHLPVFFVPSGPMASGLPNSEKARIRNLYAEGKASREVLPANAWLSQRRHTHLRHHNSSKCSWNLWGTYARRRLCAARYGFARYADRRRHGAGCGAVALWRAPMRIGRYCR